MGSEVKFEEEYITSSNGLKLFTCRWVPINKEPKALVFLCHGYAMESSISMQGTGSRIAKAGYGVYGIDYIGHGKSEGLPGYIPSFNNLFQDCAHHFSNISEREENKNKARFLMGESMGGAVVLFLHRKMPNFWNGAVLVAPMCKIADDLKPNRLVISFLGKLAKLVPTWKIVPTQDIIEVAVRDPERKKEVRSNPYWYTGRPRLQTANELYIASTDLEKRLDEVTLPFLVLHGGADKVTDPAVSKMLYDTARSTDKSLKLYPGMWHALTYGELPDNINIVFKDITEWLDQRSMVVNEREKKTIEDKDAGSDSY